MSQNPSSLKAVFKGGLYKGVLSGGIRSLDYSSYVVWMVL